MRDGVLVLALAEGQQIQSPRIDEVMDVATNASVIGAISTDEAYLCPRWPTKNAETPPPYCNLGW